MTTITAAAPERCALASRERTGDLRVITTGPLSIIEDLGRPGWFHAGVGVSGAADRRSFTLANRLLGNDEDAAAIECLLGGLEIEASSATVLAITGAATPATLDETPLAHASVIRAAAGQRIRLGMATAGMRSYLAVRGGLAVDPVLGSRSRDTLAGIGPEPLKPGDVLPVGPPPRHWPLIDVAPVAAITTDPITVRAVTGPRDDWFTDPDHLFTTPWTVSADTDRVGIRLQRPDDPTPFARVDDRELPTEGMPLGAVQIPPSGEPVVFLADHPITGGYPVVATVIDDDIPLLAQARPGQSLTFRRTRI